LSGVWPQPWVVGPLARSKLAASPSQDGATGVRAMPTGLPDRYSATSCRCASLSFVAIGRMMPSDSAS
jgi:hypothetical protein